MESMPHGDPQKRFESSPESLTPGNVLTYRSEGDTGYFISQFGWRVDSLPPGMKIRTRDSLVSLGVSKPACSGEVYHEDGRTFFKQDADSAVPGLRSKFSDGDVIEVVALPETEETGA